MPCPRTQQANLPACSPQPPLNAERQAGKLWIPFFKVFWYDSTREMNPRSTDCEADALTTYAIASVKFNQLNSINLNLLNQFKLSILKYADYLNMKPQQKLTTNKPACLTHKIGSRKIHCKQACRRKTRLRKFRRSQILHAQYLPPTLYAPFHSTLPRTFTYRACPFGVHCLLPIRRNFLRRVFLRQTCLQRIFRTRIKLA